MVKKFLIVGFIVGLLTSVGYAEVEKKVDSFDGSISVISTTLYRGPSTKEHRPGWSFKSVIFQKTKTSKGSLNCSLVLSRKDEGSWWHFKKTSLEMKIGEKIYSLPILETGSKVQAKTLCFDPQNPEFNVFPNRNLCTSGMWKVDKKIEKKILKANSIIIRIYYTNHPPTIYKVYSETLSEWKQVIRMKF